MIFPKIKESNFYSEILRKNDIILNDFFNL